MTTIVVVDDARDVRRLLRARLELTDAFEVLGEGANGVEAVGLAAEHQPDLLLLDVSMAGMDGLEAIPLIITASPRTKVVLFSGFDEHGLAAQARALGASAFIEKSTPIPDLVDRLLSIAGAPALHGPLPVVDDTDMLRDQVERFRAAFDDAAIGMATMTLTGRVVRANAALERFVGTSRGGIVGALFADLVDPASVTAVNGAILRVASGAVDAASVSHGILRPDTRPWATSTIAIVRDSVRTPLYLFLQVQDITEQREAQEQLRRSEERFRLMVENVGDYAIFMLDPDGRVASWNLGAERIKGWSAEEIIGQHFSIFYEDDARDRRHPEHELEIAIAVGRYEEEGWRVRKDGSRFWANVVITAVRDGDGTLVGFAKVTRDVTDRLHLSLERERVEQELARAARERTEFLAVTAHELRAPVTLIHGFAELLNGHWRDLDDGERDDMTDTLVRASDRLRRLVEDLLTAARLESGALDVRLERTPVTALVKAAVSELAPASSGITIDVDCDEDLEVMADPGRVQQIIGNYVSNALRHGRPPYTIRCAAAPGAVEIAVEDAGPGIAEPLRSRLFGKFSRGEDEESTGLGLFIVHELAAAQGGEARYEDRAGGGSRFVLVLPAPAMRT